MKRTTIFFCGWKFFITFILYSNSTKISPAKKFVLLFNVVNYNELKKKFFDHYHQKKIFMGGY